MFVRDYDGKQSELKTEQSPQPSQFVRNYSGSKGRMMKKVEERLSNGEN